MKTLTRVRRRAPRARAPKLRITTSKIMPDLWLCALFCPIQKKFHTPPYYTVYCTLYSVQIQYKRMQLTLFKTLFCKDQQFKLQKRNWHIISRHLWFGLSFLKFAYYRVVLVFFTAYWVCSQLYSRVITCRGGKPCRLL